MKTEELIKEIDLLCLSEKLLLVEDIRDKIASNNEDIPMPQWHKLFPVLK
ncbi:MAG: hypothetical protein HQL46_04430 [Gammaproteobacteria bacterium]|nr:hypothetical protein [Gammaproteobacteria bacterium]